MPSFLFALLRALTTPNGSGGELLSTRRKSHLLQAEWYARLAETGEQERKADALPGRSRGAKTDEPLIRTP
jgi:hypothetical protein